MVWNSVQVSVLNTSAVADPQGPLPPSCSEKCCCSLHLMTCMRFACRARAAGWTWHGVVVVVAASAAVPPQDSLCVYVCFDSMLAPCPSGASTSALLVRVFFFFKASPPGCLFWCVPNVIEFTRSVLRESLILWLTMRVCGCVRMLAWVWFALLFCGRGLCFVERGNLWDLCLNQEYSENRCLYTVRTMIMKLAANNS